MATDAGARRRPMPGRFRWLVARTVVLLLLSLGTVSAAERLLQAHLTVYSSSVPLEPWGLTVFAGHSPARVLTSHPVASSRTLLVLVDPNSYGTPEIRRRLMSLASALSASTARNSTVRIGIPMLDGILSEPVSDVRKLPATIDRLVASYLPEGSARDPMSAGRTLDLVAGLIQSAEKEAGALDCLLMFRDRVFESEGSEYLNPGMERLLSSLALAHGSTLYGWLDRKGILQAACIRSGGLAWSTDTPLLQVVAQVAEQRRRGLTLEIEVPSPERISKVPLDVKAAAGPGSLGLRAPDSLWVDAGGGALPGYRRMEEGLSWIRRGNEARADGNSTLARRFAQSAIAEDPWNPQGHYLEALAASELGDSGVACIAARDAMNLAGGDERIQVAFASTCRNAGRAAEALQRLQEQDRSRPSPAMLVELARLHAAVEEFSAAKTLFEELPDAVRQETRVLSDYAEVLSRLGLEERARTQLLAALAAAPDYGRATLLLARSYAASGLTEQALQAAQHAVEQNPTDADAHAVLSDMHARRQDWVRASDALHNAMALAPARSDWTEKYVDLLCRGGQHRAAAAFLRTMLASQPVDARLHARLGAILSDIGELEEAARAFEAGGTVGEADRKDLYRAAAELRERRGEYGQALLDYRAMLRNASPAASEPPDAQLRSHLSAISLLVDGHGVRDHPLVREFGPLPRPAPPRPPEDSGRIVIPGGLLLLTRTIGIGPITAGEPDALGRIFQALLDSSVRRSYQVQDNPILVNALSAVRTYTAFIGYLRKEGIAPAGLDSKEPRELLFPLSGEPETLRRTKRALRFFGVNMDTARSPEGGALVTLVLKQGGSQSARQRVLRDMGVDLTDQHLREFRIDARNDELPIVLGPDVWASRILGPEGKKTRPLLERFFADPRAMRLYLALAECSKATRAGLVQAYGPGGLLGVVEPLAAYGRYLDFKNGKLVLPGVSASWDALLGTSTGSAVSTLVRSDDWRALRIYASLAQAPDSVRQYLTATPDRLRQMHDLFLAGGATGASTNELGQPDLGRILAIMRADQRGLILPIDARLAPAVLPAAAAARSDTAAGFEPLRVPDTQLARFLEWAHTLSARVSLSPLEGIGLVCWLQETHPGMLDEETAQAVIREPNETAAMLDIMMDLAPPPGLLRRYLALARELQAQGSKGWNVNRARTFQSLFHLLALMRRQGALSHGEGVKLFELALQLNAGSEASFARAVAAYVSGYLLTTLAPLKPDGSADDMFFQALAGPPEGRELTYRGKVLRLDPSAFQLKRMRSAVVQQSYMPLSRVLDAFRLISEKTPNGPVESLAKAAALIHALDLSRIPPDKARGIARADTQKLAHTLADVKTHVSDAGLQAVAEEVASALHIELGVTLLTFCYAFYAAPEADAMAFDPNFVRKHDFFAMTPIGKAPWTAARLEQKDGGLHCSGSLSGLGFELSGLETAQWAQNLGDEERESLVPTMLNGIRSISRSRRTDRAQEYVALCVRFAREVMATAVLEPAIRSWLQQYLNHHLLPRRREQVLDAIEAADPLAAARQLSPSELLLLGREWVEQTPKDAVAQFSPVLARLRSLAPAPGGDDAIAFRRELDQYGAMLRRRIGINQPTLSITENYEQLDRLGREELLYERICDLKVQLADLNYRTGIPAVAGEAEGEVALQEMLPRSVSGRATTWKYALEQIGGLKPEQALGWLEELLTRGTLVAAQGSAPDDKGVESSP